MVRGCRGGKKDARMLEGCQLYLYQEGYGDRLLCVEACIILQIRKAGLYVDDITKQTRAAGTFDIPVVKTPHYNRVPFTHFSYSNVFSVQW